MSKDMGWKSEKVLRCHSYLVWLLFEDSIPIRLCLFISYIIQIFFVTCFSWGSMVAPLQLATIEHLHVTSRPYN